MYRLKKSPQAYRLCSWAFSLESSEIRKSTIGTKFKKLAWVLVCILEELLFSQLSCLVVLIEKCVIYKLLKVNC